jgi:hypothetical protein
LQEDWELIMSRAIHRVERELGVLVTEDYPLIKFLNQLEMIEWYDKEQKLEAERRSLGR